MKPYVTSQNGIITYPVLSRIPGLRHGTTSREFAPAPLERRELLERLAAALDVRPRLIACARQVHGTRSALASASDTDSATAEFIEFAYTDIVLTTERRTLVAVFTADCVPGLLVDPTRGHLAVVHASWRGTLARVVEIAIARLLELGSDARDLLLLIGPCVRRANYQVSPELIAQFQQAFPECPEAIDGRQLDLAAIARYQASRAGLAAANIHDCGICTAANPPLCESYRRDGPASGRMASFLMWGRTIPLSNTIHDQFGGPEGMGGQDLALLGDETGPVAPAGTSIK